MTSTHVRFEKTISDAIVSAALLARNNSKGPCTSIETHFISGSRDALDNVRSLVDGVRYRPAYGFLKLVLVDRTSELSDGALNALERILEEPPDHVRLLLVEPVPKRLARFRQETSR